MRNQEKAKAPFLRFSLHVSRRNDVPWWIALVVKASFIVGALLLCGIISGIFAEGRSDGFIMFYKYLIEGTFYSPNTAIATIWNASILLIIAVAITPAFKMKFWNIGAEGQVLMGCLGAAIIMKFVAPNVPNIIALFLMLFMALLFSIIWATIPALFKAYFNTNETLFTLMMNYIAIGIVAAFSLKYKATGDTALGILNAQTHAGWMPELFGYKYLIGIFVIINLVVALWFYLKYSKHGYEIAVLNGSVRTAEYVGINVKLVTIRTMILCGAACGAAAFLLTSGASHTVSETVVGGRGFTAVMISWLGHFNPLQMVLYSLLNAIITTGSSNAAANLGYSGEVASVLSGLFFLLILVSEFFIDFKIKFKLKFRHKEDNNQPPAEAKPELEGGKQIMGVIFESIRFATVFLFGSAGETVTEKSGHLNLGTPGVMCIGAMGSAIGASIYLSMCGGVGGTNAFLSFLFPFLFCILFAGLAGLLFSFITVTLHCNQNVTGLALTTFGVGLYPFVTSFLEANPVMKAGFSSISHKYLTHVFPEQFYSMNDFTRLFFSYGILVYLAIAIAIAIAIIMKKTKVGLFLRTVGENPSAADAAGISVNRYRYLATMIGSAISGLGGMFYLFDWCSGAFEFVVDAYGWLAVSLVIFTMWKTEIGIAGSLLFSFLYIFPGYLNFSGPDKKLFELVPYAATILILVITSIFKLGKAPAGLGQSYFREDR